MSGSRYILGDKIGSGGMAEIYLGKQVNEEGFQRVCVFKRILPHIANNESFISMFRDEAEICRKLVHANIVRIEGFERIDDSYAITMEFVNGKDLRSVLSACERSKIRLSVPMAVYIAAEAARALQYAHSKTDDISGEALGIVHRDVSPQNILISYEGEVKLTDFGIASAKNKTTETQTGTVKGKYSYMSPEQIQAKKLDGRSDIFSLGIVLWEVLAMRKLFQAKDDVSTINRVRSCRIPNALSKLNPAVDQELEQVVLRALDADLNKRYAVADEMEKALRKYLNTHFPNFVSSDLAAFMQENLAKHYRENQKLLKKIMLLPVPRARSMSSVATANIFRQNRLKITSTQGAGKKLNLNIEKDKQPELEHTQATFMPAKTISSQEMLPLYEELPSSYKPSKRTRSAIASSTRSRKPSKRSRKQVQTTDKLLVLMILLMSLAMGAFYYAKKHTPLRLPTGDKLSLNLTSVPVNVKVFINGVPFQNGEYVATPLTIKAKPGRYEVRISRPGYQDAMFLYQGKKGQIVNKSVVLSPITKFSSVRFVSKNGKKQYLVDVERGFYRGKTPTISTDMQYGRLYTANIISLDMASSTPIKCLIKPQSRSRAYPDIITIDGLGRRCLGNKRSN
ncbi:MAG: serine/threonine protein kinase [Pseudomonadota bacterium]|nr:serine/threonine protein kinase [Pseudomonadota bacterium]